MSNQTALVHLVLLDNESVDLTSEVALQDNGHVTVTDVLNCFDDITLEKAFRLKDDGEDKRGVFIGYKEISSVVFSPTSTNRLRGKSVPSSSAGAAGREARAAGAAAAAGSSSVIQEGGLGPVICHLNELVLETRGTNALLRASTYLLRQQFAQQFKYTSSQATQYRSPEFKAEVIKRYGIVSADHPGKIWCNALGQWVHQDLVVAGHIFKYTWRAAVGEVLGFPNINDPANALMLLKPVKEAFDVGYMCFIWEGTPRRKRRHGVYHMRWLGGPKVSIAGAYRMNNEAGDRLMFSDVDGKTLEFRTGARPYRRAIVFQARLALKQALSEGRITTEQVAEIAPNLVAASPKSANLQMYWQRFAFEDPENPPEPVDTHDPFDDIEPDSASDEEEECEEVYDGDPVPVEGCP